jgi:hypothetical protein
LWNFWIKYFHLILTKINCITLKIRSKADFKSKSQNIWQQIIPFSRTVMQMMSTWSKIWTLSGRLSLMRTVQLMKKMLDTSKNIFWVYHIRIIAPKKYMVHTIWKQTDSSIIIVRNVCVLTSASMIVYLSSRVHDRQSSEQNNRKLISLHNNGKDNKHAHEFADF